jgi:hypothetical protein
MPPPTIATSTVRSRSSCGCVVSGVESTQYEVGLPESGLVVM